MATVAKTAVHKFEPGAFADLALKQGSNPFVHPVADVFPPMKAADIKKLRDSIEAHGLQEPIKITEDGRIVDGKNRWTVLQDLLKVEKPEDLIKTGHAEYVTEIVKASNGEASDADLLGYAIDLNLSRRHLTDEQKITVAERIHSLFVTKAPKKRGPVAKKAKGAPKSGAPTDEEVAAAIGADRATSRKGRQRAEAKAAEKGTLHPARAARKAKRDTKAKEARSAARLSAFDKAKDYVKKYMATMVSAAGGPKKYPMDMFRAHARDLIEETIKDVYEGA